jgi:hypothetical protein
MFRSALDHRATLEAPPTPLRPTGANELAQERFWRDEQQRLISSHRDWPDAAQFLELEDELAHAFVLVLLVVFRLVSNRLRKDLLFGVVTRPRRLGS